MNGRMTKRINKVISKRNMVGDPERGRLLRRKLKRAITKLPHKHKNIVLDKLYKMAVGNVAITDR